MLSAKYITNKCFGNNPWDIEGFDDAISSEEMYVPHHVLEWKYSVEELKQMNRYDEVNADELIWMTQSVHNNNEILHIGVERKNKKHAIKMTGRTLTEEAKQKISKAGKGRQVSKETRRYLRHGKCSWEE